jgi:hypothetical protein
MTLEDVRRFAESGESHIRQIALTKEAARALIREHDREVNAASDEAGLLFEITARHNAAPYRILEEIAIQRMQGRT